MFPYVTFGCLAAAIVVAYSVYRILRARKSRFSYPLFLFTAKDIEKYPELKKVDSFKFENKSVCDNAAGSGLTIMACDKVRHANRSQARSHIRNLRRHSKCAADLKSYFCSSCNAWHCGHMPSLELSNREMKSRTRLIWRNGYISISDQYPFTIMYWIVRMRGKSSKVSA